jgi:hypothetical protein
MPTPDNSKWTAEDVKVFDMTPKFWSVFDLNIPNLMHDVPIIKTNLQVQLQTL